MKINEMLEKVHGDRSSAHERVMMAIERILDVMYPKFDEEWEEQGYEADEEGYEQASQAHSIHQSQADSIHPSSTVQSPPNLCDRSKQIDTPQQRSYKDCFLRLSLIETLGWTLTYSQGSRHSTSIEIHQMYTTYEMAQL